jgi:uncharacterized repeat protein (TIGR03803 family)
MRHTPHSVALIFLTLLYCAATAIASSAQTLTTLASFNGTDGAAPLASLVQGIDGNFYEAIFSGGDNPNCIFDGCGTIVRVSPQGTVTRLYSFCSQPNCADGASPAGGLALGTDGNFYGTTSSGGTAEGGGTVFKITPSGTLTTLYSFCSQPNCADGRSPWATLVQGADGNFYGTTQSGGSSNACTGGCGTVFKITPAGALTTLHSFNGADGWSPQGALALSADGNLYGTTYYANVQGSEYCCGTVFKITPAGGLTTLYSFSGYPTDNLLYPVGGLVQAVDGNFYGTTNQGGNASDAGAVFRITPGGSVTVLHSFCSQSNCADGAQPQSGLVQGTDGNLYGTTWGGSIGRPGTAFKISPGGTLTTLYHFCSQPNCTDGLQPSAGLIQASDGKFYGTTELGGTGPCSGGGCGTVFSLATGPDLSPAQFVPVTPCRLVDTRQNQAPIQAGTFQFFNIPQLGTCNIPTTAAAYALNVTVVPHGSLGYLTIWPAGRSQPTVSTMNSDGRVKANAAIVPAGASAAVSVFATDTTDVILDINGYFAAPGAQTYQFYPLAPCRLLDTRNNQHGGTLQPGVERDYIIGGHCGIPTTATAYSFNVTVVPTTGKLDYLTVWPKGEMRPNVSTLNDPTGTVVANAAIVPAGANNATAFYASAQPTDLILDVNGYFAPAGTGGLSLYPVAPCRVLDTRNVGSGQPFTGVYNSPNGIDVLTSPCAPPSTSKAFVFNATVVPSGELPYLTLWPHGRSQPNVSTLNAADSSITSNMAIVPTNDGSINAYAAALTQLILDISGYFAP